MANIYCNQSLATGNDDGTNFDTDAYKLLSSALDGSNTVAGDTLWVKNNNSTSGTVTLKSVTAFTNDPPNVIGCISTATGNTGTPPTAAMIVPGLRNGSSTRAYDQTAGNAAPIFITTVAASDIRIGGWFGIIYGIVFKAADDINVGTIDETHLFFEECELRAGHSESGLSGWGRATSAAPQSTIAKNCKISAGTGGKLTMSNKGGRRLFLGCEFDIPTTMISGVGVGQIEFIGCDFSAQSNTIFEQAGGDNIFCVTRMLNCRLHASSALVTGSILEPFRTELIQTSSATGKGTGASFQEIDIITNNGNITEETTAFRTGGADDGASGEFSLAFTPGINGTRDNYVPLKGPPMFVEVTGDGTAQTVTVYIANSLAEDAGNTYENDKVWMEVKFPSASGTANHDYVTTQMDLLATPTEITTETDSTWGSGAANRQKLTASISPDYDGVAEVTIFYAENFGASPVTLYVDPRPVIT